MSIDAEIAAMGSIADALGTLEDDETRSRVLRWAAERYKLSAAPAKSLGRLEAEALSNSERASNAVPVVESDPVFNDFVDLFDAIDPKTDLDRVLSGAYWLQVVNQQSSWQSLTINNLLKDTGHGVGNITKLLTRAQNRSPALVRQMAKSGRSAQSRKTYKLTSSGIGYLREKLDLTAVPSVLADEGDCEGET